MLLSGAGRRFGLRLPGSARATGPERGTERRSVRASERQSVGAENNFCEGGKTELLAAAENDDEVAKEGLAGGGVSPSICGIENSAARPSRERERGPVCSADREVERTVRASERERVGWCVVFILKGWKSLSPGLRGTSYPGLEDR